MIFLLITASLCELMWGHCTWDTTVYGTERGKISYNFSSSEEKDTSKKQVVTFRAIGLTGLGTVLTSLLCSL